MPRKNINSDLSIRFSNPFIENIDTRNSDNDSGDEHETAHQAQIRIKKQLIKKLKEDRMLPPCSMSLN